MAALFGCFLSKDKKKVARNESADEHENLRILAYPYPVFDHAGLHFFYFIQKNLSMAMPGIEADLGISKEQLGIFLTLHGLIYGFSCFANGILTDRVNPRYFMAAGLLLCAIANFGFGMSTTATIMGIFWVANGWFQGMGFPPCAKSLSHWFATEERGIKFSIWNTSHSIGAGLVFLLNAAVLRMSGGDWRFCFFVPASLAVFRAFFLWECLRDTPESIGLMPVEEYYLHRHGLRINNAHENGTTNEELEEKITEEVEKGMAEAMAPESWVANPDQTCVRQPGHLDHCFCQFFRLYRPIFHSRLGTHISQSGERA